MACGIPMRRTGGLKLYLTPCAGLRRALTCPPPHAHLNTKTNTQQTIDMRTRHGHARRQWSKSSSHGHQLPLQGPAAASSCRFKEAAASGRLPDEETLR